MSNRDLYLILPGCSFEEYLKSAEDADLEWYEEYLHVAGTIVELQRYNPEGRAQLVKDAAWTYVPSNYVVRMYSSGY